jgi:transcriptional regulator with XRE-family HTH domain
MAMTPPAKIDTRLARALRDMREHAGLSQEELARRADLTVTAVGRTERGRVNPTWTTLSSILAGLKADLADLQATIERTRS